MNKIDDNIKKIVEISDNALIEFLKEQGFRPKKTEKYMKSLRVRLARKGLAIYDLTNMTKNAIIDNYTASVIVTPRFTIRSKI